LRYQPAFFTHLFLLALPTDKDSSFVSKYAEPDPWVQPNAMPENPWHPFDSRLWFDFAHHQFVRLQTSEDNTDISLDLLKAAVIKANGDLKFPWLSTKKMYETIDQIQAGPAPFRSYHFQFSGTMPPTPPKWMTQTYELHARDPQLVLQQQLATPEFADKFTPTPYRRFQPDSQWVISNLMSGDWAWDQAV
jgi:hypothetical protein